MKTKILKDKKILLFSPAFFAYENKIKDEMENLGAEVKMYDERSVTSSLARAVLKVCPWLFNNKTYRYYKRIIANNQDADFDYILIVRCDMVTKKVISLLRKNYSNAKLYLHLWDSIKNVKGIKKKIDLFDYVTSFDRKDCLNDTRLVFRPLFYTDDFVGEQNSQKYDLCFCGTIHSDRYFVLKSLFNQAKKAGLKTYLFPYLQSKFIYYYYKLFAKGFKKAKKQDFSFDKKTISEVSAIEKETNIILDIQHPKQTGLSMRTIEMIGAKKKIITTNYDVINYDFYDPNNILIIDRRNPKLDLDFLKTSYLDIPFNIYQKYSLEQWIIDVLKL